MNPNIPQYQTTHFLTGIASCAGCGASMLDTGATLRLHSAKRPRTGPLRHIAC